VIPWFPGLKSIPNKICPRWNQYILVVLRNASFEGHLCYLKAKTITRTWLQELVQTCKNNSNVFSKDILNFETLCWSKLDEVRWTQLDDIIQSGRDLDESWLTNTDAVIKMSKFKILQRKLSLRIKPELDFLFSWGKTASLYTWGNQMTKQHFLRYRKQLLINESR